MKTLRFGGATIDIHDDGLTITRYGTAELHARAQDNDDYRARALALGYGDDCARMSREHELGHSLLAHWLDLARSPTLYCRAVGRTSAHWREEEALVLSLQRFARKMGVSLEDIADALSKKAGRG